MTTTSNLNTFYCKNLSRVPCGGQSMTMQLATTLAEALGLGYKTSTMPNKQQQLRLMRECELHADFAAMRRGGADPIVLKEALFDAILFAQQDSEWSRLRDQARADGTVHQVLNAIAKSKGLFGVHHARFMDFPPDNGISLWTKIWKTVAGLGAAYPVAIALIPALVFLAETSGSKLTQLPAPGFAMTPITPSAPAPVVAASNASNTVAVALPASSEERTLSTGSRQVINPPRKVASFPTSRVTQPEIPSPPRTSTPVTQPQPVNTSAQNAFRQVTALNEQQRKTQQSLARQAQASASLQRQQDTVNRSQQVMDSLNRSQSQMQAQARASQVQDNFARANQQVQQTTRFVNQAQAMQNSQVRQQATIQNAIRVDAQAQQAMRQASAFNNVRPAAPYIPPAATLPPRIYTPQVNTYTPPRTYTPPPNVTPPRVYTPPPTPYVPPPRTMR